MKLTSCEDRLKNMMIIDKSDNPSKIIRVVKAELYYVLRNYFEIDKDDMQLEMSVADNGRYILKLVCESRTIKSAKTI